MLPKILKCFSPTYYFAFLLGILPYKYNKGTFEIAKFGLILWCVQFCLAISLNWNSWELYKTQPCNNALSCAVFIQQLLSGFVVFVQVSLIIMKNKQIKQCLNMLLYMRQLQNDLDITMPSIRVPVLTWNCLFKSVTLGRSLFINLVKRKLQFINLAPYIAIVTQIEIENSEITLFYLAAASLSSINNTIEKCYNQFSSKYLKKLQYFHNVVCDFCENIEAAYTINITVSVFSVLVQLLLVVYFETTLNVKPIKRNLLVDLFLIMNVFYVIMNILRIAVICKGCSKIYDQHANTQLLLQKLLTKVDDEDFLLQLEYFATQVRLRQFQITGLSLFPINMKLVTQVVSMVSIYATTMVGFTTFSADTALLYDNFKEKTFYKNK